METLIAPRSDVPSGPSSGTFAIAIKPDVPMGLIVVDDIGAFAALAFEHPDEYLGKTMEIAGDALTPPQVAAAISRVAGRTIPYVQIPIETLRQQNAQIARAIDFLISASKIVSTCTEGQFTPEPLDNGKTAGLSDG